ncbi:class A sortase [Peptostreptococcus porci]|nr:class A sortase [Peptostreptococcus porci]MDD7183766.1 class A sortase [Peptostreptococcus porci]MDY2793779.1 class A sortase [Peptostreptococcus porci]MDY5479767.1 class A sortase [Peptostreptococcus porci]MDY5965095.1 class A sortase [Peptostreptococcus porci]
MPIFMKKFIAIVIILAGVVFFSMPKISELLLEKNSEEVKIEHLSDSELEKNAKSGNKSYDQSKIDPIDVNGVILNRQNADMSKIVGQLVIPSINKNIAIFDGLENNNLMYGACTMKPSQKMGLGNYSIAGHYMKNDKLLFGGLMNVKMGDSIRITNKKNIYEYEVFKTLKVTDDRVDLISDSKITESDGKAIVSLMTCYYDEAGYRYFVIGKFKKLYPYSQSKMLEGLN